MNIVRKWLRQRLLLATASGLVASAPGIDRAWGQIAPDTQPPSEQVVVTGTRIKTSNVTSDAPITVVTAAEIAHTSAQTIEEVLTRLPEIGTTGVYSSTNNGGGGSSCIDLRNLGVERTLVLVDGKRFVHTSGGDDCVDLNNIPLAMVDRIEVLKDGASSTYGADAVAGVINIILKHDFHGVVVKGDGSLATTAGDDRTGDISVTAGDTFGAGNFALGFEYLNRGPVRQADRDWATPVIQTNDPKTTETTGSIFTPNGLFFADGNNTNPTTQQLANVINSSGTGSTPYTGANSQRYNFGADQWLNSSLEKESITELGTYKFNEFIEGYAEGFYTHRATGEQLAPQPVSGGLPPYAVVPDAYVVPEGNPYLTSLLGPGSGPIDLYKRMTQFGPREYRQTADTYQINIGLRGSILDSGWDYDVFFQYGHSSVTLTTANSINFQRLEQEVGFQQTTATAAQQAAIGGTFDATTFGIYNPAVCQASAGCVLSNPFGQNMSQAAIDYARFTQTDTANDSLKIWGGTITKSELYTLPWTYGGATGVSFGVEHRREDGAFNPDSLVQTGVTEANPSSPTLGGFDVTEVYGEILLPLLKDAPFAKDLHVNLGGRWFDYNTFGAGEIWKANADYTPVKGIKVRASDGTAFREPSITDLYAGQGLSFVGASDPCATVSTYTSKQQAIITANCAKQGVNTSTFTQIGSQIQTIVGGNPNLQPETARTQTVGVVLEPPFIPGSSLTLDFFRTKVDNNINSVDTQDIVNDCYESIGLSNPFCKDINPRLTNGQLSTVIGIDENLGEQRTEGIDIGANYRLPTERFGIFSFEDNATYVFKFQQQNQPNGPFIGFNGTVNTTLYGNAYPRLRDNFDVTWRMGDLELGYRMRFIDGMLYYSGGLLKPSEVAYYRTPGIFYHDIYASYDWGSFTFNLGADNLLNKNPPLVIDTATNTDSSVYDILGRVVYLKATLKFGAPPPPLPPEKPADIVPPPPPSTPVRTYLVFFDWDRADLTARARDIVATAAQSSQHVQTTRIEVDGYTDLSGTLGYNQRLSVRRAQTVQKELIKDGVPPSEIAIHGYGESNPLVPTAPGVREPQNRRVEIILKS